MNVAKRMLRVGRGVLSTAVVGLLLLGGWLILLGQSSPVQAIAGVVLVDTDAVGVPDGLSWGTAYTNVQDALTAATNGDEIWVAEGLYYPDEGAGQTNDSPASTFQLINGIELYGGFAATETMRSQRNVAGNVTVLSGDLTQDDLPFAPETDSDGNSSTASQTDHLSGANAYHVVTGSGTNGTAVLDGFTVTAGLANGGGAASNGGGMFNDGGSPSVSEVTFSGNSATNGGGMYNFSSSPSVSEVTFSGNSATSHGGGMYNASSSPSVSEVTFSGNSTTSNGGGMYNASSNPSVSEVTFSGNSAAFSGGGMYNFGDNFGDSPSVSEVTFSGNSAAFNGGGMYNFNSSPSVSEVTFSGNSAAFNGGGMYNFGSGGSPIITSTIIANSTSGGDCVVTSLATITDGGHNLIEDTGSSACNLANGTNNNIVGSDPGLGPLADNGGATLTHKPNNSSIVIDAGAGCSGTDQRGAARPYDDPGEANVSSACDIGAVEVRQTLSQGSCGGSDLTPMAYGFPFTNGGSVTVTVTTANGLKCLTIEEMGTHHSSASTPIQTGNWWHISGNITSGVDVALTLPYVGVDATTRVCKWPGNLGGYGWDCGDGSNTTFMGNFVTRSGITGFSDWAVGQGAGPTAVTLQASDVVSTDLRWLVWAGVVLLLLSAGTLTAVRRRS